MNMDIDTRTAFDDTGWSKGKFQILFFSMGQGDCCVITCPDGKHLMIDCGSKATEKDVNNPMIDVQKKLRGPEVLGLEGSVKNKLEALILTHPDADHINKVDEILGGCTYKPVGEAPITFSKKIEVKKVYFSEFNRNRSDFKDSPLRQYKIGNCSNAIYNNPGLKELNCVTLNREEKIVDTWALPSFDSGTHSQNKFTDDSVTIVAADDKSWSVSIIAGNVKREDIDNSDGDGRNAASLVTLIRIGHEKILICGDATSSTENYLVDTFQYKDDIKNVSLLQAPHHGSGHTSSTKRFLDLVKPKNVVISVQQYEHAHHLPGAEPIKNYSESVETDEKHTVQFWRAVSDGTFNKLAEDWKEGKKVDYTEEIDGQNRTARYIRNNIGKVQNEPIILDGFNRAGTSSKFVLQQVTMGKAIRQTAGGHLFYWYP